MCVVDAHCVYARARLRVRAALCTVVWLVCHVSVGVCLRVRLQITPASLPAEQDTLAGTAARPCARRRLLLWLHIRAQSDLLATAQAIPKP